MAYRVILGAFFGAFVFAAVGAVITTTKQVHDHKIATLERGRNYALLASISCGYDQH